MFALLFLALVQAGDIDSKDPAVARKAFEAAIAAGDEKALEAAAKSSAPARLALAEIRAHKRFGENYPPVRLVTFKAADQPIPAFVEDLSNALAIPIEDYHKNKGTKADQTVSLDLVDAYPMEALDGLLRELNAQGWYTGKGFQFTRGWTRRNPHMLHWRHGAFFPHTVEDERTLNPLGAASVACTLTVIFRHDGASRIVALRQPRSVEGVDDRGATVKGGASDSDPSYYFLGAQGSFKVRLEGLTPGCQKMDRIRGVLPVVIPEKRTWKEVLVGAGKVVLEQANIKLTVENFESSASTVKVHLQIPDPKKTYVIPDARDFELVGRDGARLPASATTEWKIMNAVMELTFKLPDGFAAAALRVGSFEALGEHEIPFEFREVKVR
ncbi:MAG TPA: hypothetical protein VFC90_03655 [Planctomycetota bacterium]|nr:hypothetical protein [Planctomycetota bacterium]